MVQEELKRDRESKHISLQVLIRACVLE